jgi:Rod binding domain-containing protein
MTSPISPLPGARDARVAPGADHSALRDAAAALDGMFVRQLVAAMRATVPTDSLTHGGAGEEMFTAMLDEQFADAMPAQWSRGIADALLARLAPESTAPTAETP